MRFSGSGVNVGKRTCGERKPGAGAVCQRRWLSMVRVTRLARQNNSE